jgi:hypothetical protein
MSATGDARSAPQVRDEIERERQQLASALDSLRGEIHRATDVTSRLRAHLALGAGAAFAAGFVLSGGPRATARVLADSLRRRRRPPAGRSSFLRR